MSTRSAPSKNRPSTRSNSARKATKKASPKARKAPASKATVASDGGDVRPIKTGKPLGRARQAAVDLALSTKGTPLLAVLAPGPDEGYHRRFWGHKLKFLLDHTDLTVDHIAARCGVHTNTVYNWPKIEESPSIKQDTLERLSDELGLQAHEWLMPLDEVIARIARDIPAYSHLVHVVPRYSDDDDGLEGGSTGQFAASHAVFPFDLPAAA